MLDAACPGDVFAAPPSSTWTRRQAVATPEGRAPHRQQLHGRPHDVRDGERDRRGGGIKIATVLVDDDVAVKDSTYTVGRRGVAGNFFVIKAVGAASERGAELEELVALASASTR